MKILFLTLVLLLTINLFAFAQCNGTATSNSSGNWTAAIWTFAGGATSPSNACTVFISAGHTVTVTNAQTTSASIEVRGILDLSNQLRLGTITGCGQSLRIFDSGQLTGDASNDRLSICGVVKVTGQPGAPPAGGFKWPADGGFTAADLGGDGFGFDESPGVLPIELLSFEANSKNESVVLTWSTASQLNFDYFVVQHSVDGFDWMDLTQIKGAGTTNEALSYSFEHTSPVLGKNYYRLKSVDFDETFEYSFIVGATVDIKKELSIYPNPASINDVIHYELNFTPGENDIIVVYDVFGVMLKQFKVSSIKGSIELPSSLKAGTYLIKCITSKRGFVNQLIVK